LTLILQIATLALVGVGIAAVIYLIIVLVKLRRVLTQAETMLETTRKDVDATLVEASRTLQRLEAVAQSTEQVMREEVAPTLRVARETLTNIEVTTRAVADTTLAARRIAERADTLVDTQRLLSVGGAAAHLVLQKSAGVMGSLLSGVASGVGSGVRALLASRRNTAPPKAGAERALKNGGTRRALPDAPAKNELITEPEAASQPVGTGARKRTDARG
jgi:uncharacterized protein YoxC